MPHPTPPAGAPGAGPAGPSPAAAASPLRAAFAAATPIMLGYVVLGLPCGILASAAGMQVWMVAVMSLVFYSGAGQYMIPNMWLAGNPVSAIVASVGLVNTRQMLYGATLSRFCGEAGHGLAALFGATVTDESFGVNYARLAEGGWSVRHALFVNLFSLASWTVSNVAGAVVGEAVSVPTALASFAMTSLFICLLCMQELCRANVVAAVAAALGVVLCKLAGLSGVAVLAGALLGVAAALAYDALHPLRGKGGNGRNAHGDRDAKAAAAGCPSSPGAADAIERGGDTACR